MILVFDLTGLLIRLLMGNFLLHQPKYIPFCTNKFRLLNLPKKMKVVLYHEYEHFSLF